MDLITVILTSIGFILVSLSHCQCFLIGSFNVQIFGQKKSSNTEVVHILTQVIQRYDIILILEVRDSSGTALPTLLNAVNKIGPYTYGQATSGRLGRTVSKEQYAFLYRINKSLEVLEVYQYPDTADEFERGPFAVRFYSSKTALKEFTLVAIHTDPDKAVPEMIALEKVFSDVTSHWKDDNVLVMGDYNAGCSYASKKALNNLEIRKNPKYKWFISDDKDTTAGPSDCAYDRFVITGQKFIGSVDSTDVYRYDTVLGLNSSKTLEVSDHYPIEMKLKLKLGNRGNLSEMKTMNSSCKIWPHKLLIIECVLIYYGMDYIFGLL